MKVYVTTRVECSGRWQLAYEAYRDKATADSKYPAQSGGLPIEYDLPDGSTMCFAVQSKSPTSSCKIDCLLNNRDDAEKRVKDLESTVPDDPPIDPQFPDFKWEFWIVDMEIQ